MLHIQLLAMHYYLLHLMHNLAGTGLVPTSQPVLCIMRSYA